MRKLKRIVCRLLLLAMLISLAPDAYAESATSSSKIYYPVDLSATVAKSTILQQVSGDCAIVSMATIEAYLHGVTSDADKRLVYSAVCAANNAPGNNYAYWGNVGYATAEIDWNTVYEKLEAGYPTIVHRPVSDEKPQHWSVVAGYIGSAETLEPDNFLLVDVYPNRGAIGLSDGSNIQTVAQWRGSATVDRMAIRRNGIPITSLSGGIRLAVNYPKQVHTAGTGHSVFGYVVSDALLTSVRISIIDAANGNMPYDKTVHPYAESYQVHYQDADIKFTWLPKGEYYYTVRAEDSAGNTKTLVKYFIVDSQWPVSQPAAPTYSVTFDNSGIEEPLSLRFLDGSFTLPGEPYPRRGYLFQGWRLQRTPDNRWYIPEVEAWMTDAEAETTDCQIGIFEEGYCAAIDESWLRDCGDPAPEFTFYAQWEKLCADGHTYVDNICSVCGEAVSAPEEDTVTRVFGADRYATSFKAADTLKAELGVSKFQNVIVASGTGFADALAGSYLAAVKNAPILLVRGANVNDVKNYIKANLADRGTVYLLGGVNAVPASMETGLDGFTVKRLGGANRYDTNLLILKEAGVGNKDIIVCTGLNFADSLSASASGLPILLVKDGLLPAQKDFLSTTSGKKIIVGGTAAVNATVEKQLASYGEVKRLAGNTRYDTSVLVAKEFFSDPTSAVLAYAQNFPDGLSGGPLAYCLNAPLILTDNNKPTAAVNYATSLGIKSGYVLGGTGLISDKVVKNIFSMTTDDSIIGSDNKPSSQGPGTFTYTTARDTEVLVGDTLQVQWTYTGNIGDITFKSGNPTILSVDGNGVVTGISDGGANVLAYYGDTKLAQVRIQIVEPVEEPTEPEIGPAVEVRKSGNNGSWEVGCVGNSLSFHAVAKTANGENRGVIASSSNTGVATVSCSMNSSIASVNVSFKGSGSTTITLISDDGNASTSFTINVREYTPQNASTPEAFVAACNYVIEMNGCAVRATGSYKILTFSDAELSWRAAVAQGQTAVQRGFRTGSYGAKITYEGVNEEGLHVFHSHG